MEPALFELLGEGSPDDTVSVILRLDETGRIPDNVRVVTRFGNIATCRLVRGAIPSVRMHPSVASMKAPRLYGPVTDAEDSQAFDDFDEQPQPGPGDQRRPDGHLPTGHGIIVAHIDWGLDFAHPDFRLPDGSTRVIALWDQSAPSDPAYSNRYGYGRIHEMAEINRALKESDPYSALGYEPSKSDSGRGCHGTHTVGIACGNGRSGGPLGLAPDARIVFVELSTTTPDGPALLGHSVAFLEGLDFIATVALYADQIERAAKTDDGTISRELPPWYARPTSLANGLRSLDTVGRPFVINASIGRQAGQHDGKTLTEQGIDAFLLAAPGRAICQSAGNYFDRAAHAAGIVRPGGATSLRLVLAEGTTVPSEIDLWYSGVDRFGLSLVGPEGAYSSAERPNQAAKVVLADGREVGRLYHRIGDPNNGDNEVSLFLDPEAPAGEWVLTLSGEAVSDGRFHAWIERTNASAAHRTKFHPDDVDRSTTLGTICNGFHTLAVGAYDAHQSDRPLARFSSCGPSRDGRWKPDLVAPGVRVLAARSRPRGANGAVPLLARMSGTSMATPHGTGTVALMFAAARRRLPIETTRALLLSTVDVADVSTNWLNRMRFGCGYLDTAAAVDAARHVGRNSLIEGAEETDEINLRDTSSSTAGVLSKSGDHREENAMSFSDQSELAGADSQDDALESEAEWPFSVTLESDFDSDDIVAESEQEVQIASWNDSLPGEASDIRRTARMPSFSRPGGMPFQVQVPLTGGAPALALPIGGPLSPIAFSLPLVGASATPGSSSAGTAVDPATTTTLEPPSLAPPDLPLSSDVEQAESFSELMRDPEVSEELEARLVETALDAASTESPEGSSLASDDQSEDVASLETETEGLASAYEATDGGPRFGEGCGCFPVYGQGEAELDEPLAQAPLGDRVLAHAKLLAKTDSAGISSSAQAIDALFRRLGLENNRGTVPLSRLDTSAPTATGVFNGLLDPGRRTAWSTWQRQIGDQTGVYMRVIAQPRQPISDLDPMPGDLFIRVARGEGWGNTAVVASPGLFSSGALASVGLHGENFPKPEAGLYVHVIEPVLSHRIGDERLARRLADESGRVLPDTVLARFVFKGDASEETEDVGTRDTARDTEGPLRKGSVGERVKLVQKALNRAHADLIALGLPGLPGCPLTVDGQFDAKTESTVIAFQQKMFNDPAKWDGTVGPDTWGHLEPLSRSASSQSTPPAMNRATKPARVRSTVKEADESSYFGATLDESEYPTLRRGARGPSVLDVQHRINIVHVRLTVTGAAGLAECPLVEDGVFGDRTYKAVLAFQRLVFPEQSSEWDGVVGPHTWTALEKLSEPTPTPVPVPVPPVPPSPVPVPRAPEPVPPAPNPQPPSPGNVEAGREVIGTVPLLLSHRGTAPDLILRWNAMAEIPTAVDVVLHFHGFSDKGAAMRLDVDKEGKSGLDFFDPDNPAQVGRLDPTLCILPRGNFYGGGKGTGYDFPALTGPGGVSRLVEFALTRFAARIGVPKVARRRLILTAHSGGGAALVRVVTESNPDEVEVFDALYTDPSPLVAWATSRIQAQDATSSLRVFHTAGGGTASRSLMVQKALEGIIPRADARAARYRVEATSLVHGDIPRRFGWQLLRDAGADVPPSRGKPNVPPAQNPPPSPPPSPQPLPQSGPVTQDDVDRLAAVTFGNAADIEAFFSTAGASTFADWFNTNLGGHAPFVRGNTPMRMPNSAEALQRFREFWNLLALAYDQPRISFLELASLMCIVLNETSGDFASHSETSGRNQQGFTDSHGRHPGLAYFYDRILLPPPRLPKPSYNRMKLNRTAGTLFNDEVFIRAHGQRGGAQALAHRGDDFGGVWNAEFYPQDQLTTDEKASETEFIRQADFFKFRGRGVIQTTGRINYKPFVKLIQAYKGSDATLKRMAQAWSGLSLDDAATFSSDEDWDQIFRSRELLPRAIALHAGTGASDYRLMSRDVGVLTDVPPAPASGAKQPSGRKGSIFFMGRRISGDRVYAGGPYRDRVLAMLQAASRISPRGKSQPNVPPPQPILQPPKQQGVPAPSPELMREQWNAHPRVHAWFSTFSRYSELAPVYASAGIGDAAAYLDANIVSLTFFGRRQDGHRDLVEPLRQVESAMLGQNIQPPIVSFGCLVPRAIRGTTDRLSNHALGRAFDLNPADNPRITQPSDYVMIGAVIGSDIKHETDAGVLSRASRAFQQGFTPSWISSQTRPEVLAALNDRHTRERLDGYAKRGFCNLYLPLIEALVATGLRWGGAYHTSKDFMHFELL